MKSGVGMNLTSFQVWKPASMGYHHPWWRHSHRLFSPFLLVTLSGSKGKTPKKQHCPEGTKEHYDRRWPGEPHEGLYKSIQPKIKRGTKTSSECHVFHAYQVFETWDIASKTYRPISHYGLHSNISIYCSAIITLIFITFYRSILRWCIPDFM